MSVLYRAVWSDTGEPGVPSVNKQANIVAAWATETSDAIPLSEGTTDLALSQGRQRTIVHREVGPHAFEVIVNDQKVEEGTEWTTVIRIISDGGKSHVLVETSMDSVDLTRRVSIGRPRVVHELLVAANKPTLGASVLLTEQLPIPANGIGTCQGV